MWTLVSQQFNACLRPVQSSVIMSTHTIQLPCDDWAFLLESLPIAQKQDLPEKVKSCTDAKNRPFEIIWNLG